MSAPPIFNWTWYYPTPSRWHNGRYVDFGLAALYWHLIHGGHGRAVQDAVWNESIGGDNSGMGQYEALPVSKSVSRCSFTHIFRGATSISRVTIRSI